MSLYVQCQIYAGFCLFPLIHTISPPAVTIGRKNRDSVGRKGRRKYGETKEGGDEIS